MAPELVWQAYEQLESSKVKKAGPQILLTNIIALVKFAMGDLETLEPYPDLVEERFLNWMTQQESRFTPEQRDVKDEIKKYTRETTQANVGVESIKNFIFPLPPLAEQHQIVQEVERLFSITDNLETTLKNELKRANQLRQSILKQAFLGKLVPQDPNDEPAGVLLDKIRGEKSRVEESKKNKKEKSYA